MSVCRAEAARSVSMCRRTSSTVGMAMELDGNDAYRQAGGFTHGETDIATGIIEKIRSERPNHHVAGGGRDHDGHIGNGKALDGLWRDDDQIARTGAAFLDVNHLSA